MGRGCAGTGGGREGRAATLAAAPGVVPAGDLKIENILISSSGVYKLCDFGSCTTRAKAYTERREILEESDNIQRYTTLIYRAPEMVDLYQAMHVGEKVDVWALGCILYTMSFGGKHPFAEGSALQIMSAEYTVPTTPEYPDDFIALLRALLTRKPEARCSTTEALTLLERLLATASEVALGAGPEPEAGDQVLEGWHMKKEKGREQKKRLFGRSSSGWDKVWLQLRDARLSFFAEPKAANALGFVELGQAHGGASTRAEQRADEGKHAHLWAIVVRSGAEHLFGPCSEEGDSAAKASRARWLAAVNAAAQMPAPAEKEDAPQPIRARSGMPSSAQSGDGTTGSADSFSGSFSELAPSTRGGAFDSLNSDTLPTQLEDVQPDAFDFGTGAFQGDAALADTAPGPAGGVLDAAAIRAATVSAMGLPPPASAAEEAFDFEVDFGQAEQQEDMLAADWASFDSPAPRFESPQPQAAAAADSSAPAAAAVTRTFISDAEREEANASLFSALDWKEDAAQPAAAKPAAVLSGFGGGGGGGGDSGGSKAGGASQAAPVSVHRPLYRVVPKSVSYHRELETSSKKASPAPTHAPTHALLAALCARASALLAPYPPHPPPHPPTTPPHEGRALAQLGTLPCGELIAEIESGTTKKGLLRIRFSRPDFGTDSVGWTSVVLPSLDSASSGKEKTGEKEKGVTLERIIDTHGSLHRTVSAEQEAQEEEEAAQEEAEEAEAAEAEVEAPYDFGDFGGVSLEVRRHRSTQTHACASHTGKQRARAAVPAHGG